RPEFALCYVVTDRFEGASAARQKLFYFPVKTNMSNGHYKIKIPMQQIKAGYCDWVITSLTYATKNQIKNYQFIITNDQLAGFTKNKINATQDNMHINLLCNQDKKCKVNGKYSSLPILMMTSNQKLNINFIAKNS
ncbi:unnamed protein product, partial [marine sediment metagenome]